MDAATEIGRNPVGKHQIQPEYRDEQADRDGTAGTVSRDQILRRERGQRNIRFPCSADHEQEWQPYPVDSYSCYICDHTYTKYTYMVYIYPYQASGSVTCVSTSQVIKYASNSLHLKCPSWVACVKYVTIVVCFTAYKSGRKPTAHQSLMSYFSIICL